MANPAMKLDTLNYAKKLIEAGCEPKLAEAHASLQQDTLVEISEDYLSQFATHQDIVLVRQDIAMLEQRINSKFEASEERINGKFEASEERVNGRLEASEQRINGKFEASEERVNGKFNLLEQKIASTATKTTVILGGIVISATGVLLAGIDVLLKLHI